MIKPFRSIKRFLTLRATVLTLIGLVTASILTATLVPQTQIPGTETTSWIVSVPYLNTVIDVLGLNRVVGTVWFAILVVAFLLSLLFSLSDQFSAALNRLRRQPPERPTPDAVLLPVRDDLDARLKRQGFSCVARGNSARRFVKGRWGYFGNPLLHAGMALVILSSLVYVMTEHRLLLRLIEGEPYWIEEAITAEARGALSPSLPLPKAIMAEKVTPTFWENDQNSGLSARIIFPKPGEEPDRIVPGINDAAWYRGMRLSLRSALGVAFALDVTEPGGRTAPLRLMLPLQPNRNRPGYGTLKDVLGKYTIKAKYLGDETKQSVQLVHPLLTVRLLAGERLIGEGVLRPGETVMIGATALRLNRAGWWIDLVLEGSYGMTGIFLGFGLLIAGVIVVYVVVPREITVWDAPDGMFVSWRAFRLEKLYREEWERTLTVLGKGDA